MLKKSLLALAISAASMASFADSVNKLTVGNDLSSLSTSYDQTLVIDVDADISPATGKVLSIALSDASFLTDVALSDIQVPNNFIAKSVVVSNNSQLITLTYDVTGVVKKGSLITVSLPNIKSSSAPSSATAADADFVAITVSETGTSASNGFTSTGKVNLVSLVVPYTIDVRANSDVMLSDGGKSFLGGLDSGVIGTISLSTDPELQNEDGTQRIIESTDEFKLILTNGASVGNNYASLSIGGESLPFVSTPDTGSYTFSLDGFSGDQQLDVAYTLSEITGATVTDALTFNKAGSKVNDSGKYDLTSNGTGATSPQLAATIVYSDPTSSYLPTVINSITNSLNPDLTYVRVTNNSASVALVNIDVTDSDGTDIGTGALAPIQPNATVVYKSKDIETAIGTSWDGRANAAISATENITVVPLIRTNNVLTNQAGSINNFPAPTPPTPPTPPAPGTGCLAPIVKLDDVSGSVQNAAAIAAYGSTLGTLISATSSYDNTTNTCQIEVIVDDGSA